MLNKIEKHLSAIKEVKPLILNLTNYVTMDLIANSLLALGAAPLMSVCDNEIEELIKLAHAITINLGTLDINFISRCKMAARLSKQYNKPLILDPTGAGASVIRTQTARQLMVHADIVRGNASEIISILDNTGKTLGVESCDSVEHAKQAAKQLAIHYQCTVVVSGDKDFITDGTQETVVPYGTPLMSLVTGMGCTQAAVIAAFASINSSSFESAVSAAQFFGICGHLAAMETGFPGSFRQIFIDKLYAPDFRACPHLLF